jgi:hypothetical protein
MQRIILSRYILFHRLHRATSPLFVATRSVTSGCDSAVILHANADTRHKPFSCLFSLFFDVLPHNLVALSEDEGDECYTNKQCQAKQDDVDRNWVVLEDLVCRGIKSRLREIEDTG